MKTTLAFFLTLTTIAAFCQPIVGTWQLTEEKTCFQSETPFVQSETEKELSSGLKGASNTSVAKIMTFTGKGTGEEGIFSKGKKKGTGTTSFRYKISGNELHFLDKKSGMITSRFVIEELSQTVLRFHDADKECEIKAFVRVK